MTFRLLHDFKNNRHFPPGPRGLPILGNILQLASASQIWLIFDEWKSQYGPIMYLSLAGQHVIVLNTKAAAIELLERRSAIYSDRPKSIVGEYIRTKLAMPFVRYGKQWQRMWRAAHAVLNARASARYQPVQIEEAVIFAHKLMCDTSLPLFAKIARSASSMISVIYGKQLLESSKDPLQVLINIVHIFTNTLYPGAHLVECLPLLDYLPTAMAKWTRKAKHDFQQISNVYESYYNIAVGGELGEVEKAWIQVPFRRSIYDYTTVTLSYFLYAMSLHPSVQERAQHELDEVVGRSRIPTFDDMMQLPYIRAIVKEANTHTLIHNFRSDCDLCFQDDWYKGYFIPKGTIIFPNVMVFNVHKK
ncbi:cytochrome P450 [Lentinula aff. lateritia]|uniref:Cytochrome P450 n=1 Tax=Lentinula aff. lateritia TaxID=2804960 RepID=A0ACC1TMN3_9AGAR|nr:cytochrome P450 [Lentinula aff. lateritia]